MEMKAHDLVKGGDVQYLKEAEKIHRTVECLLAIAEMNMTR